MSWDQIQKQPKVRASLLVCTRRCHTLIHTHKTSHARKHTHARTHVCTHEHTHTHSPRLPSTPSNHNSLPSNVLYLQGIHNTCSKHRIIQYLRNHIWHSWHLWPCNLPKIQNKFILILIWSGDNKTQRNTARERIHAHRYTHRGKRNDVLQCCWKRVTNRAPNEFFGTFYNAATKHAGETKRAGRTSQYDTGWQNTGKRPIFNIPGASSACWCYRKCSRIRGRSNR